MRVVVTGGKGALGQVVVAQLVRAGHAVAAISGVDLADYAAAEHAVAQARTELGGFDAIIHLAGRFRWAMLADTDVLAMRAMFSGNVETLINVTRAALPALADGGAIVTVGAASAQPAGAGFAAYASAKSAVARLTEVMASELGSRGIRANGVLPGIIDTPANRADMPDADFARWTSPGAIAEVICFLASDASRAINGAMIPVANPG